MRALTEGVDQMARQAQLSRGVATDLKIILDEVLSNALRHGFATASNSAEVVMTANSTGVEIEITDDGVPFDPTTYRAEPMTLETMDHRIGGFGISFVRHLVTEWQYSRDGGLNRLFIRRAA